MQQPQKEAKNSNQSRGSSGASNGSNHREERGLAHKNKPRRPLLDELLLRDTINKGKNAEPNVDFEFERTDLTRGNSLENLQDNYAEELKKYQAAYLEKQNQQRGAKSGSGSWKYFLGMKKFTPATKERKKKKHHSGEPKRRRGHSDSEGSGGERDTIRSDKSDSTDDLLQTAQQSLSKSFDEKKLPERHSRRSTMFTSSPPPELEEPCAPPVSTRELITTSIKHVPHTEVKPLFSAGSSMEIKCCRDETVECFADIAAAWAVNLYPLLPDTQQKLADPLCDYFRCQVFQNRVIAAVADGCGWGFASATAALLAVNSVVCFLNHNQHFINNLRDAGELILDAFACAHDRILYGFTESQMFQVGTTTICGGILLELDHSCSGSETSDEDGEHDHSRKKKKRSPRSPDMPFKLSFEGDSTDELKCRKEARKEKEKEKEKEIELDSDEDSFDAPETKGWAFICASVGDCKAIRYSWKHHELTPITGKGRSDALDQRDPGGRLGPHKGSYGDRCPDVRNLGVYSAACDEGDIIILMTDGIYDNFDPQMRGLTPKDLMRTEENWADVHNSTAEAVKECWMLEQMLKVICPTEADREDLVPHDVVTRLTESCRGILKTSVSFMEENPNESLPQDYRQYPGKMDHAACVAFKVGQNHFLSFRRNKRDH